MLQAVLWRRQPTDLNSLSVLYCFRALAALDEQSSRTRAALITCSCSSALQAVCALHALLADQALWQAYN